MKTYKNMKNVMKGNLDLRHTNITSLPKSLKVGGDLFLNDKITSLPDDWKLGMILTHTKIDKM